MTEDSRKLLNLSIKTFYQNLSLLNSTYILLLPTAIGN